MTERADAIRGLFVEGLSKRGIAARLGISDRTVRNVLAAAPAPLEGAEYPDWIAPEHRVLPTPTREQLLFEGGVSHPGKAWTPCPWCGHAAWRDRRGIDAWTCGCGPGPRSCHYPGPYRFQPFPGLPPEVS